MLCKVSSYIFTEYEEMLVLITNTFSIMPTVSAIVSETQKLILHFFLKK